LVIILSVPFKKQLNFDKVKKTIVILLMLIYGSATMGATVHMHYCMNQLVGWSLYHDKDDKCGRCGMEEKDQDGCCKDEHKHVKLKVDHQKSNGIHWSTYITSPALVSSVVDFEINAALTTLSEIYSTSHAPPDIERKRLQILYSIFLI